MTALRPDEALPPEAVAARIEGLGAAVGFGEGYAAHAGVLAAVLPLLDGAPATPSGDAVGRLAAPRLGSAPFDDRALFALEPHLRAKERGRGEVPQRHSMTMRVFLTGATGLIGRALAASLAGDGHEVVALSRSDAPAGLPAGTRAVKGDPAVPGPWQEELSRCDACVNLAGEPVAGGRWTEERRKRIRDSRVLATRNVSSVLVAGGPTVLVNGSAIGYYGPRGDEVVDETFPAGNDFLGHVAQEWEEATRPAAKRARVVLMRTGIVLSREGGALPKLVLPFKMLAGGPIGDGGFWQSWIHVADQVGHPAPGAREPARPGPDQRHRARPGAQPRPGPVAGARAAPPQPARGPGLRRPGRPGRDGRGGARQPEGGAEAGAGARVPVSLAVAGARAPRPSPGGASPMTDRPLKLAVVGATGSVGRAVLEDLEAREIPVELRLFATSRSEVDLLEFRGDELEVETVSDRSFRGCDAAILAVPAPVARGLAPKAWADGCLAIDLSGAFRSADGVPLVVAGVNDADVAAGERRGIVATPSGPVVPLALALAPIHREAGLVRVVVTILYAASGAGRAGAAPAREGDGRAAQRRGARRLRPLPPRGLQPRPAGGGLRCRTGAPTRRRPWARSCAGSCPRPPWAPPPPPSASRSSTRTDRS